MARPRPVTKEKIVFVTRRCTQRQFLLRPGEVTNEIFTYCVAEAASRYGLVVLLPQMMSNHHHTMLWDPDGRHVEFREHLHKMLAKVLNAYWGRWENLWAAEESCVVEVVEVGDLLDKLVYIATNPVKDGLVEKVHHWPGPKFTKALLTGTSMTARRPKHFFAEDGTMPEEVELVLRLPDHITDKGAFLAELECRIAEVEATCARERMKTGRRVLGRRRVLRQSWRDSPTSHEPRRNLRPRVAARSKWARLAVLERNKQWEAEYREARLKWLAGEDAEFPYGTYWLRRFANVRVKPPPLVIH